MSNAASLNPETFTEGSGLIDDVDVTVKEARFEMFDYQGSIAPPGSPSLKVVMVDEEDNSFDQYYSMGSAKDWMPGEDGKQLISVGSATGIRMSSNGGIFLKSLIDAGFPVDKIGDDISVIDGLKAHVIRVPMPKRSGIVQSEKQKEREAKFGPATILIVSEIRVLPWEKTAAKPKTAPGKPKAAPAAASPGKAKPAPAPVESAGDDDLTGKATMTVMEILANEGGSVSKKDLPAKIFQLMKSDADRNAIVKLAFDDEFLSSGPWVYADGSLVG